MSFPHNQARSLRDVASPRYSLNVRVSRVYIIGGSVLIALVAFFGMGFLVVTLQEDLARTRSEVDRLQDLSSKQNAVMGRLEGRLGEVGRGLVDIRRLGDKERARLLSKLESQSGSEAAAVRRELSSLESRVANLKQAAEEHATMLAAARANEDVEIRYKELMSPTVRVNARHEVGSGTILWSRASGKRARTYILTAWHIVQDNVTEDGSIPLEVDFYAAGELLRSETGKIVSKQARLDLALLEVRGYHAYSQKARIPRRSDLPGIKIFSKVYAIGCPLGYSPLPTSGELTSKDKELDGNHYWMINAPTIFGNSGGGIYVARSRTLIGVLSRISAYKNMIDVAVPHMGLVTSMDQVYDWLDKTRYSFVYKDRLEELKSETKGPKALTAGAKKKPKK